MRAVLSALASRALVGRGSSRGAGAALTLARRLRSGCRMADRWAVRCPTAAAPRGSVPGMLAPMSTWSGPALPTGTLTFLFTDVEGSTRLWETHSQAMRQVMARHDALLTAVFERHDGVVVRPRGEGDSLFVVFVRASDAVAAALAGQRALLAEDWGDIGSLRVRMGLHTGEADLREGDYYGSAVNRCARLRSAGHGGQILLSEATAVLVRGTVPQHVPLVDVCQHRLKYLSEA